MVDGLFVSCIRRHIQIHELIAGTSDPELFHSDFAFRLLYNGKILTPLVPGCPEGEELCDVRHFKALVDPIATRNPDCGVPTPTPPSASQEVIDQAQTLIQTTEGILMLVGLIFFGLLVGAVGTYVLLTGRLPCSKQRVLENTAVDDDDEARQGLQAQSSYFDEEPITNTNGDDDSYDDDFGNGDHGRIDSISTGLQ